MVLNFSRSATAVMSLDVSWMVMNLKNRPAQAPAVVGGNVSHLVCMNGDKIIVAYFLLNVIW